MLPKIHSQLTCTFSHKFVKPPLSHTHAPHQVIYICMAHSILTHTYAHKPPTYKFMSNIPRYTQSASHTHLSVHTIHTTPSQTHVYHIPHIHICTPFPHVHIRTTHIHTTHIFLSHLYCKWFSSTIIDCEPRHLFLVRQVLPDPLLIIFTWHLTILYYSSLGYFSIWLTLENPKAWTVTEFHNPEPGLCCPIEPVLLIRTISICPQGRP